MDKLFGVYFMEALAEAKRTAKREENRKRRRKMAAETNAEKAVVCAVCRTYGGTLMNRHGGGYICRECRRKEKRMKPETMDKISELLKQEMMRAREDLLYAIECDLKSNFDKKIAEYHDAYKAYMDFEEWREEQED